MTQILQMIARMNQKPKLIAKNLVVHIDDMVEVAREFRKAGYQLKRGYVPDGTRGNFFEIRDAGKLIGIMAVNRNIPRGEVYAIEEPERIWTMERIKVDFDYDDWYVNRLTSTRFQQLYYGHWMKPYI